MASSEPQFRIAEIDVAKNPTDEKIVGIFRYEAGSTKQGPVLLIVAEIHSTLYVYERLLDVLNATAEQARMLVTGVGQDPIGRFEKLVQRLNEAMAAFHESEATPVGWSRINIFVIELSEGHLCLTGTGKLMNTFLQKQEDGSFRSFDLLGSLEQPAETDPKKPFASLLCGDIAPGDVLIVGSQNLERLRGEIRVKDRLTSLPPVTAALELSQDLEKRGIPDHFVAAVIACCEVKPAAAPAPAPAEPETNTSSVEKLRSAEENVAQHLSPVISPLAPLSSGAPLKKAADAVRGLASRVSAGLRERSWLRRRGRSDGMALASLRGMNAGYGSMFTKQRKTTLVVAAVLIIALIGGISWWNRSKAAAAATAAWNASYEGAVDKKNKAESDLIYGNETSARTEIAGAEQALSTLATDTDDRKARIEKLAHDIGELKEKLKRVVKADNVTELAALSPTAAEGKLAAPVLTKDAAYAVDNDAKAILKIDLASKDVKRIPLPSDDTVVAGAEGTTSILFATKGGKLLALKKSDDAVDGMKWSLAKSSSTTDIAFYASRIYSLDPQQNQVWRYALSGGTFGQETAYIKATNATIDNAVSLAIDSSVYILKSDGTLIRFLSGGQEGFGLAAVDPVLRAASAVWTDANAANVYVTDPADKRIVVFDKNGQFRAQIVSTSFRTPRDIVGDEANKRAVVVDGNRLLLVPLP